jgi:hypothetical protein
MEGNVYPNDVGVFVMFWASTNRCIGISKGSFKCALFILHNTSNINAKEMRQSHNVNIAHGLMYDSRRESNRQGFR